MAAACVLAGGLVAVGVEAADVAATLARAPAPGTGLACWRQAVPFQRRIRTLPLPVWPTAHALRADVAAAPLRMPGRDSGAAAAPRSAPAAPAPSAGGGQARRRQRQGRRDDARARHDR